MRPQRPIQAFYHGIHLFALVTLGVRRRRLHLIVGPVDAVQELPSRVVIINLFLLDRRHHLLHGNDFGEIDALATEGHRYHIDAC